MSIIAPVLVPKESANDDWYLVDDLLVSSGARVSKGDVIAVLETSKTTFEVVSPADGFVFYHCVRGDKLKIGAVLAFVSDTDSTPDENEMAEYARKASRAWQSTEVAYSGGHKVVFSQQALELIERCDVDKGRFSGKGLVRREDVERAIASLSGKQRTAKSKIESKARLATSKVLLLGGGRHSKMCIDILRQKSDFEIIGIADCRHPKDYSVLGVPVICGDTLKELKEVFSRGVKYAVNAVGAPTNHPVREATYHRLQEAGFEVPNLFHSSALIEPSVLMEQGNQIMGKAILGSDARIGENCIVNSGAIVSHDCILDDNVHIAPGAVLGGGVKVGSNTLIGMGVTIYMDVHIGRNVVIHNGVNVFADVPDGAVVS